MDSKPYVRLSATQGTNGPAQACNPPERALSSSSSFSGSLPIRAPPTPDDDDDDSDFDSNVHKLSSSSSNSSDISVGCESGSECEAFVSGEEFETASERPLVADPDGNAFQESGFVERYELSWPFVANPDEYEPVVENVLVGNPTTDRVMPIAQLSWESDDNDVMCDDEAVSEVEDGEFLGPIKVPGNEFVEKHSNAPRVKVFEVEEGGGGGGGEEEEEEEESVKWKESLVVKQYEPSTGVKGVEGSDLDNFVEGQNGDSVEAEWIEGNGLATAETDEPNSVELNSHLLEGGEKAKYVAEESFVHCSNSKRKGGDISGSFEKLERGIHSGIELRVEGNENQMMDFTVYKHANPIQETVYLESCDLSEVTKGNKSESALCSDFLKSITLSSVSVTLLGENVATGLKIDDQIAIGKDLVSAGNAGITAVQFQGDTAYGANVEAPFKEKDFFIYQEQEQEQTYLGLHLEKISVTPKVIFEFEEGEECKPAMGKESLVIKLSEPALEVMDVEGSELNSFVKGQNEDSIQADRIEGDSLGAAEFNEEINEPNSVELNINEWGGGGKAQYMAEESIMHCLNKKRNGVDISVSFGTQERGIHSGIDFGVERSGNQMMDSTTYSQPDPFQETLYLGNGDLSEVAKGDKYEYVLYTNFLELITASSDVAQHIFRGDTKVKTFKINGTAGVTVTLLSENVVTGLKIEDQIAIGKHLVLSGSAGAVQFEGDTAYGAKMEVGLEENFTTGQNRTSLGLSLMKLSGGFVLTTDILSLFSVGSSKMAVHVVLNNKQRGKIAIRTSSSDKLQSALVGIVSIAVSIFGIFCPKFGVQK